MPREHLTAQYTAHVNPIVMPFFTRRQIQLMELIANGKNLKEAAQELGIKYKTAVHNLYGTRATNLDGSRSEIGVGGIIERMTGERPAIRNFIGGMIWAGILTFRMTK